MPAAAPTHAHCGPTACPLQHQHMPTAAPPHAQCSTTACPLLHHSGNLPMVHLGLESCRQCCWCTNTPSSVLNRKSITTPDTINFRHSVLPYGSSFALVATRANGPVDVAIDGSTAERTRTKVTQTGLTAEPQLPLHSDTNGLGAQPKVSLQSDTRWLPS
ncbi:hypothetical protein HaLaN_33196 [Haematococcus lacustris]|uniref:Uncharacterized protein n=1 Tax=Haematococcus lacustris TaxID=44745 RepID=A0A6A0ALM3_HAELA|nr:hypothetical protein HaLaN_33196 [Haematococcus lacustris]